MHDTAVNQKKKYNVENVLNNGVILLLWYNHDIHSRLYLYNSAVVFSSLCSFLL